MRYEQLLTLQLCVNVSSKDLELIDDPEKLVPGLQVRETPVGKIYFVDVKTEKSIGNSPEAILAFLSWVSNSMLTIIAAGKSVNGEFPYGHITPAYAHYLKQILVDEAFEEIIFGDLDKLIYTAYQELRKLHKAADSSIYKEEI